MRNNLLQNRITMHQQIFSIQKLRSLVRGSIFYSTILSQSRRENVFASENETQLHGPVNLFVKRYSVTFCLPVEPR